MTNQKVDINERGEDEKTALHYAIMKSDEPIVRYLIEKGADPNIADENGMTPLHAAAIFANDMDIVELLLNHKDLDFNCLKLEGRDSLFQYALYNLHGLHETITNRFKEKGGVMEIEIDNEPALNPPVSLRWNHLRLRFLRHFYKYLTGSARTKQNS